MLNSANIVMNRRKCQFETYLRFFHMFIVPEKSLKNARLVLQENNFLQNEIMKETSILPPKQIDLYRGIKKTMLLPSQIGGLTYIGK